MNPEDFKNRSYLLQIGGSWYYLGIQIKRLGKEKFEGSGRKGNWREVYDIVIKGSLEQEKI